MHVINYILLLFITMQMMTIIRRVVITPAKYTPTIIAGDIGVFVGVYFAGVITTLLIMVIICIVMKSKSI